MKHLFILKYTTYPTYHSNSQLTFKNNFNVWYGIQGISFEPYGSVGYLEQLRNRVSDFEFLLVMGNISMECSMDLDYFAKEPSSAVYLQSKEEVGSDDNYFVFTYLFYLLSYPNV